MAGLANAEDTEPAPALFAVADFFGFLISRFERTWPLAISISLEFAWWLRVHAPSTEPYRAAADDHDVRGDLIDRRGNSLDAIDLLAPYGATAVPGALAKG
jgi:hypothetical protein